MTEKKGGHFSGQAGHSNFLSLEIENQQLLSAEMNDFFDRRPGIFIDASLSVGSGYTLRVTRNEQGVGFFGRGSRWGRGSRALIQGVRI